MPRPPWKIGVYAALIVIALAGVFFALFATTARHSPDAERVGEATGDLAVAVGIAAYLVARWRARK